MSDLSSLPSLVLFILVTFAATAGPRLFPLYLLRKEPPSLLRDWLGFVPAAVMAALLAPDALFYGGTLSLDPSSNLFLAATLATLLFARLVPNYFAVIVFGMAFVALARLLGLAV